jgi:hypothetical protein
VLGECSSGVAGMDADDMEISSLSSGLSWFDRVSLRLLHGGRNLDGVVGRERLTVRSTGKFWYERVPVSARGSGKSSVGLGTLGVILSSSSAKSWLIGSVIIGLGGSGLLSSSIPN